MNKCLGDLKERGHLYLGWSRKGFKDMWQNEDTQRMVRLTLCADMGRIEKYTIPDNIVSFIYHSSIHLLPGKMQKTKTECFLENPYESSTQNGRQGETLLER